jgi:chromosome segregation ATPase
MFEDTLTINGDALRESVHAWALEQEALESEWNESLSALEAYQSHLDSWQRELAQGREALRAERETFERERAAAAIDYETSSAQIVAQLADARAKVAQQSEQLLTRTEELRALDQQRAGLAAELEVARSTVKQLSADLDEQKRVLELERKTWTEQLGQFRDLLEQRAAAPVTGYDDVATAPREESAATSAPRPVRVAAEERRSPDNPVLGSILEQFGKLRQQRASDRRAGRNAR